MAKIKTDRPEAAQYNGREAVFVRDVVDNEPAFSALTDQTVVNIDGVDLYFYASEVALTEDEEHLAEEQRQTFERHEERVRRRTGAANANRQKLFATYRRNATAQAEPVEQAGTGPGMMNPQYAAEPKTGAVDATTAGSPKEGLPQAVST